MKVGSFGYVSPFVRYHQNISDRFGISVVGEYTYAENDYPYDIKNGTVTQHDRRTHNRMNQGHAELDFIYHIRVSFTTTITTANCPDRYTITPM